MASAPALPPLPPGFTVPQREATPPLGLPAGSVRALLALILSATLWYLIAKDRLVPDYLADTAFLAVAFYFGARTSDEEAKSERPRRQPLFLPRGIVRGVIALGFFGVYGLLWYQQRAIPDYITAIAELLLGYVVGVAVSVAINSSAKRSSPGMRSAFGHARALLCLVGVSFLSLAAVLGFNDAVPPIYITALQFLVSFYFGSRAVR